MHDDAPLTSNEKALTISVLIIAGLIALFTVATVASSMYVVATGKVAGSEMTQAFTKAVQKDPNAQAIIDQQLALQAAIQKRWAPVQLGTETAYLLALGGAIAFAAVGLRGGRFRARLGWFALAAAGVRVGTGVVTFLFTTELMRATTGSILAAMPKGSNNLSPEKAEEIQRFTTGAMQGVQAASAGCVTLVVVGYFAVVAYVFLAAKKPATAKPAESAPAGPPSL
ncbi:MAG: hypothetical protein JNK82_14675 [Myxococcaceae bacterium]|nr:hypothetical protein [Myxococcaceae bacterium]